MQAAEVLPGSEPKILASDREVTRLGSSVFRTGSISAEAMDSVCKVLSRFAAGYRSLNVVGARVVATSAVRDASNQDVFIGRASEAVGTRVEVISGLEEARLIHMGVQSRWPQPDKRILIVDVGGGSAELILAENGNLNEAMSRPLGAVRLTEMFMKSDPPQLSEVHRLEQFIDEKLERAVERIGQRPVDRTIATSATAAAIVSSANGIARAKREEADRLRATRGQVRQFFREAAVSDSAKRKKLAGVGPRRADIIIAGTAVFLRVMENLSLNAIHYSVAGVRDGIIADLAGRGVGREMTRLSRDQLRAVENITRKYGMPVHRGKKVSALAHTLFDALHDVHKLPPAAGKLLEAASYVHDVGHFISATGHHKHSAYIIDNSDMPAFTERERTLIAQLCRYHRKAMPSPNHAPYQTLSEEEKRTVRYLFPLLRIAEGLDSAQEQRVEDIRCAVEEGEVRVRVIGDGDIDLELWAAERSSDTFQEVYGLPISFTRERAKV